MTDPALPLALAAGLSYGALTTARVAGRLREAQTRTLRWGGPFGPPSDLAVAIWDLAAWAQWAAAAALVWGAVGAP